MENYLVRTKEAHWAPSELSFFRDEEGLTALEHLTMYLKNLILLNEYAGTGAMITNFWRWDENDVLTRLTLDFLGVIPEGDSVDWEYRVTDDYLVEVTKFRVRMEGI